MTTHFQSTERSHRIAGGTRPCTVAFQANGLAEKTLASVPALSSIVTADREITP